jgi:hypothetical protein
VPLDDGWGPSPTQKYVSATEKDAQMFCMIVKFDLLLLGKEQVFKNKMFRQIFK